MQKERSKGARRISWVFPGFEIKENKKENNKGGWQAPDNDKLVAVGGFGPAFLKKVHWEQLGAKFSLRHVCTSDQLGTNPQLCSSPRQQSREIRRQGKENVDRKRQTPQATFVGF